MLNITILLRQTVSLKNFSIDILNSVNAEQHDTAVTNNKTAETVVQKFKPLNKQNITILLSQPHSMQNITILLS